MSLSHYMHIRRVLAHLPALFSRVNSHFSQAAEILYLLIARGKLRVPDILAELALKLPTTSEATPEPETEYDAESSSRSTSKTSKKDKKGKGKRQVLKDPEDDDVSGPKLDRASTFAGRFIHI